MSALCIVASPLSAARAARRLCDAQGGILFGPTVSTLERLVPGLLAGSGDRRAVLSPLAERLLAAEAGRAAGGSLASAAPDGGLAAALAEAIAELRRGEVTAGAAREAAKSLAGGAAARLYAMADALDAYEGSLRRLGVLDRAEAARAAADAARRGASSPEIDGLDLLVVDGIAAASAAEWDLLAALAGRARRTRFHLPYFADRPDLSAHAEPLLRRVEALHEIAARREIEVVLPRVEGDGRAPRVAALLAAMAGGRVAPPLGPRGPLTLHPLPALDKPPRPRGPLTLNPLPRTAGERAGVRGGSAGETEGVMARGQGHDGLLLAEPGAGEAGEASAVVRVVARLLDDGFAPGEVVVVAPAPRRAAPGLARAFAAAGIPFAAGRGGRLADAPPVRAVMDALRAAGGLDRSAAERLAVSSYLAPSGLPGSLPALLDRAGALDGRGPPQHALRSRAARLDAPVAVRERGALLRAADALDDLERRLRSLSAAGTAREHAARLAAFLDASGIRRRAARAPRDVAARDLAALAALGEAAERLAQALSLAGRGAERLRADEFRALAALAVDGAALPPAPEPAAGAVELWGVGEAAGLSARAAVISGCARGALPAPPPPEPLLREPERLALCRHLRRAAVATAPARRAEAAFEAFCAVAAGREALAFVWPAPGPAGDGGPLAPLVADALAALDVPVPDAAPGDPPLSRARTPREALRAAARAGPAAARVLMRTPLAERTAQALARAGIEAGRRLAVQERRARRHAGQVGGRTREALRAALPEEWSPTQLEEWARCPFRLFCKIVLRLDEPGADGLDIEVRDEGSLLHAVLERWVRARVERRAWPPAASEADLVEARAAAEEVFSRFEREGRTGDPAVWAAKRDAVLARLDRVVRAEARDHGGLVPALVEHAFGGRSGRPPLAVSAGGETVRLKGRVDRVDAGPDSLLVIDYKNSKAGRGAAYAELLDPESFGKTSFQIPTYLLAALRDLPGRPRLAATYELLRSAERVAPLELRAGDPILAPEAPVAGSEGPRPFAASVVGAVRGIRDGEFPIVSRNCERCPFGAICRFEGVAAAGADEEASP